MLWTLGMEVPFDQRLDSAAEAGYRAVELAGEYATWTEGDFRRYSEKRRALGITFDSAAKRHGRSRPVASQRVRSEPARGLPCRRPR